jgi:hypothetical protein
MSLIATTWPKDFFQCLDQNSEAAPTPWGLHIRFSFIAKSAPQPIEIEILSALDEAVFGTKGVGSSNVLAIWACLWCLILIYRKLVRTYKPFQEFPEDVLESCAGKSGPRVGGNDYTSANMLQVFRGIALNSRGTFTNTLSWFTQLFSGYRPSLHGLEG